MERQDVTRVISCRLLARRYGGDPRDGEHDHVNALILVTGIIYYAFRPFARGPW